MIYKNICLSYRSTEGSTRSYLIICLHLFNLLDFLLLLVVIVVRLLVAVVLVVLVLVAVCAQLPLALGGGRRGADGLALLAAHAGLPPPGAFGVNGPQPV